MTDISVIIITWNNEDEITSCVDSVIKNTMLSSSLKTEIVCIDNNSSDKTFDLTKKISFDNLQVYKNESNTGFTSAVNQGIKYSHGEYILLLNPDVTLNTNCIEVLYQFLEENENYAACAPLLLNEDGSVQYSIRNFPDYAAMFY